VTFTTFYIPRILRSQLGNPYYVPNVLEPVFQDQGPTLDQRMSMIRLQDGMTAPATIPQQEQKSNLALALMTVGVLTSVIGLGLQVASFRRAGG